MDIRLKRAYEPASPTDGYRVLIDRLWPRGISKEQAKLDEWEKEMAPSTLRKWFGHEPSRFDEFRKRYIDQLRGERFHPGPCLRPVRALANKSSLPLRRRQDGGG